MISVGLVGDWGEISLKRVVRICKMVHLVWSVPVSKFTWAERRRSRTGHNDLIPHLIRLSCYRSAFRHFECCLSLGEGPSPTAVGFGSSVQLLRCEFSASGDFLFGMTREKAAVRRGRKARGVGQRASTLLRVSVGSTEARRSGGAGGSPE
jgi:hypothetical protein